MKDDGNESINDRLLASHALWARDYYRAFELLNVISSETNLNSLSAFKTNFELAIVSKIVKRPEVAQKSIEKLENVFKNSERVAMANNNEYKDRRIEKTESSIIDEFMKTKFDYEKVNEFLYAIPEKKDSLELLISPNYSRNVLKSAIRRANKIKIPEVRKEGIFSFTVSSDFYRVTCRAYTENELELERLLSCKEMNMLAKNSNSYYIEDEELRIISGLRRDGLVLSYYLVQGSKDTKGLENLNLFLRSISRVFSQNSFS